LDNISTVVSGGHFRLSDHLPWGINERSFNVLQSRLCHPDGAQCQRELLLAGDFEFVGGSPQSDRKDGDHRGPDQREKAVVAVNQTEAADELTGDDIGDDEAVLVGTFGGIAGGYMTYALLKLWTDRIFRKRKDREANQETNTKKKRVL
jgi:hypothetical protein